MFTEKKWKGWIHRLYSMILQMCLMGFLKIAPLNNSGTVALPAWQAKLQLCSGQVFMIRDWCWPGDKAIRDKKRRGKEHLKTWNEITWASFIGNALRFAHISCSASANSCWLIDPSACSQAHCSYSESSAASAALPWSLFTQRLVGMCRTMCNYHWLSRICD